MTQKKVNSSFFARNASRIFADMEANKYAVTIHYKGKPAAVAMPISMYEEMQNSIKLLSANSKR